MKGAVVVRKTVIRLASAEDLDVITEMGLRFLEDTVYHDRIATDPDQVRDTFERLMVAGCQVLVAETEGGRPIGLMVIMVSEHPLTRELTGHEVVWWVEASSRGRVGRALLLEGENLATQAGAVRMQLSAWNPRLGTFYGRVGYQLTEWIYQKEFS